MRDVNEHFGGKRSRRGFLGLVGRAGVVTVGVAAGIAATANPASAGNAACCNLEFPPGSGGYCKTDGHGNYICPGSGNHWTGWTCCTGSRTYQCAECRPSNISRCGGTGAYVCSAYWTVNPRGCSGTADGLVSTPRADPEHLAAIRAGTW